MHKDDQSWQTEITRRGTVRKYRPRRVEKQTDADFILSRIEPDTNGGCWLWASTLNAGGYGYTPRGLAHRLSYRAFVGDPGKMLVCHTCDVRCCVNPKHLWLGTHKDNTDDMMAKDRGAWVERKPDHLSVWHDGDRNPSSKLNSRIAADIRQSGEKAAALALRYGVSISTINRILSGSIWVVA